MKTKVIKIEANSLEELFSKLFGISTVENNMVPEHVNEEPEINLDFFVERIAVKKGWKPDKVWGYLNSIAYLNPMSAFNIILREIAIWLDMKYEDHIENSEHIYAVSTLDGRIHEINKKHIKNYRNFAAFRTVEDAKFACSILRDQLKDMFKSNAKE